MQYFEPQYQTYLLTPQNNLESENINNINTNSPKLQPAKLANAGLTNSISFSSHMSHVQTHQNMPFAQPTKRRRSSSHQHKRKFRNENGIAQENEWPKYSHPEGGIIQFTPWGNIRKYNDASGNLVTKFEDGPQDISHYIPSDDPVVQGPMMQVSPANEVEGYRQEIEHGEYQQEHENYFGMMSEQSNDGDCDMS